MKFYFFDKRQGIEALAAVALGLLCLQLYFVNNETKTAPAEMVLNAERGQADMSLRNADFPQTFIRRIDVDLTSPQQDVRLAWSGPGAARQETGPFHSSPGCGHGNNDCNDFAESNRGGSHCTPKGKRLVEGFGDFMPSTRTCKFVTWFHSSREIAFHSHSYVPDFPASMGCVRLDEHAAQLIHNNAVAGRTEVVVGGVWTQKTGNVSSKSMTLVATDKLAP